jgi:ATP synthase protein I
MVRAVSAGRRPGLDRRWFALLSMSEGGPPDPLARLGERLDRARAARGGEPAAGSGDPALQQGVGVGLRIGVEFVVAIVVATGLGWALDRWLGTRPWGTIVLFFLGVGAGMVSVYRAVTGIKTAVGLRSVDEVAGRKPTKDEWDDEE